MHKTSRFALRTAAMIAVVGGFAGFASPAAACNDEAYIGTMCTFAFDWCPRNYIAADGRTLAVREYQALFSLLGYRYGGNNADLFAIPDLRGRSVVAAGLGTGFPQSIALGQKFGTQQIVLTNAQVPLNNHTHTAVVSGLSMGGNVTLPVTGKAAIATSNTSATKSSAPSANAVLIQPTLPNANIYGAAGTTNDVIIGPDTAVTGTATGTISLTGTSGTMTVSPAGHPASQPVNMYPPSLGQTVCIVANGLYPNRP